MKIDTRSRRYAITINNPSEWPHSKIASVLSTMNIAYYCMADEIGLEKKTPHTHIFFATKVSAMRFSTVKKLFPEAHIEAAKGTSAQNRAYVQKSGKWAEDEKADTTVPGTFEEWGSIPEEQPGQRTDLTEAFELLQKGASVLEIIANNPGMMKYRSHLEQTRQDLIAEEYRTIFRQLDVTYIYGKTAYGKTRYVMEKYGYQNTYRLTGYERGCFDTYMCQDVLLMDEYASSFRLQELNNHLDGYPHRLSARYTDREACYTKVFIISNIPLENQYPNIRTADIEMWRTFARRIHHVMVFHAPNEYNIYSTAEYLDSKGISLESPETETDEEWDDLF